MADETDYTRTFIGARYVPVFDDEQWNSSNVYEPLTMVQDENNNIYISTQYVPSGITLDNTDYWKTFVPENVSDILTNVINATNNANLAAELAGAAPENAIIDRGAISTVYPSLDFNDIKISGIYNITTPNTYLNNPAIGSGLLLVTTNSNNIFQLAFYRGNYPSFFIRFCNKSTNVWSSWDGSRKNTFLQGTVNITSSNYTSLNFTDLLNMDVNVLYFASSITNEMIANLPYYGLNQLIIKFDSATDTDLYKCYIAIVNFGTNNPAMLLGRKTNATTINWKGIKGQLFAGQSPLTNNNITSLDDLLPDTYSYINTNWLADTNGLPANKTGYLYTIGNGKGSWATQFFILTGDTTEIYKRSKKTGWASWYDWQRIDVNAYPTILNNHWNGKSWYAYGTSMTAYTDRTLSTGETAHGYAYYLPDLSGLQLTNKGIGGSGIVPSRHGGLSADNTYTRLMDNTDGKTNADLITVEIIPNDTSAPLGNLTDVWDGIEGSNTETFMGCLANILKNLQENTNAQIVVLIATTSRYQAGSPENTYTPEDKTIWHDFVKMTKEKCMLYNVPVIAADDGCGLGIYRMGSNYTYVGDQIHLTAAGGYNLAKYYWSILKNIPLWYTSV